MSRYDWDELLKGWQTEALTMEQAIGQLLLWGQETATHVQQVAAALARLQQQLEINEARLAQLERRPPT